MIPVYDAASGVDPASITMRVNAIPQTVMYDNLNGTITYTPEEDLEPGVYTVQITCSDIAGNEAESSWSFTIQQRPTQGRRASYDTGSRVLRVHKGRSYRAGRERRFPWLLFISLFARGIHP